MRSQKTGVGSQESGVRSRETGREEDTRQERDGLHARPLIGLVRSPHFLMLKLLYLALNNIAKK